MEKYEANEANEGFENVEISEEQFRKEKNYKHLISMIGNFGALDTKNEGYIEGVVIHVDRPSGIIGFKVGKTLELANSAGYLHVVLYSDITRMIGGGAPLVVEQNNPNLNAINSDIIKHAIIMLYEDLHDIKNACDGAIRQLEKIKKELGHV